jgi:hypothetical protein
VESYLPYEGKVVIRIKAAERVAVRIPGWADRTAVRGRVNGGEASPFWVGNYVVFDRLSENDVISIEFPVVEETVEYTVPDGVHVPEADYERPSRTRTRYTCHFKGNTLVDVSPRGGRELLVSPDQQPYPIYQRDRYRGNRAPMKKVTRYVAPYTIRW